ncbi:MAG: glutamate--tRNA ligase [Alphaproteobacteria bacterium]|nr:glutamate--tRNA ligase [Alphaproteobacteria bacterium]
MTVSVRIAPSPTGLLHIGNIRAALFNFLFARRHGGSFMLRMDDTDRERSTAEYAAAIERDLAWLGLTWDRFERQSDRRARYAEVLEQLKASGRAYPCFETQAELDLKRKTQLGRGLPPVYDRAALKLTDADRARLIQEGRLPHWRFKLEHTEVVWDDAIQKHKSFPAASLSDPVLVRGDGVPLYTFCSVIDDADFGITHIIRGEDHVTNTAVQIQLWQAITDKPVPQFAHFPLLVSATGTEMSKRLGTLSISSMRDEDGIEPMAINALLARLGTSEAIAPCLSLDELAAGFDLHKISRATPKFDLEELKHISAKTLHHMPYADVAPRLKALKLDAVDEKFWNAVRVNLSRLEDIRTWWQVAQGPVTPVIQDAAFIRDALELLPALPWDENTWSQWTSAVKNETGTKGKELFMPLRLALTGLDHGPEMKTFLPLIGYERAKARLEGERA